MKQDDERQQPDEAESGPAPQDLLETVAKPDASEKRAQAEEDVPAEWNVGDVILDTYEVKEVLGEGSFGTVHKVHHKDWNVDLAVKSALGHVSQETIVREAEVWMELGLHPNIVSCHFVRTLGGIPRIFVEYVEGGTSHDWLYGRKKQDDDGNTILIEKPRELTRAQRLGIAIEICRGMQHAHSFEWTDGEGNKQIGLVHRDLKPQNILMTEDGMARVTDFGLVRFGPTSAQEAAGTKQGTREVDATLVKSIRQEGGLQGTPAYAAPEQWGGHGQITKAADVYAFGVILYELFCGRRLFELSEKHRHAVPQLQLAEYERMHCEQGPPDPASQIPEVDAELSALMLECLAKDPKPRPASFAAINERLKAIYERLEKANYDDLRPEPKAADLLADGLNNRALSYLEMGQRERAGELWEKALKADPHHLESTYNRGLLAWRRGEVDDGELLEQVRNAHTAGGKGKIGAFLSAPLHGERGDFESVVEALREYAKPGQLDPRLARLFGLACLVTGKFKEGKQTLEAEVNRSPANSEVEDMLTWVAEKEVTCSGLRSTGSRFDDGSTLSVRERRLDPYQRYVCRRSPRPSQFNSQSYLEESQHGSIVGLGEGGDIAVSCATQFSRELRGPESSLRVWRINDMHTLHHITGLRGTAGSVAMGATGERLACVVNNRDLRVWDSSGDVPRQLTCPTEPFAPLSFTHDEDAFLAWGPHGELMLFGLERVSIRLLWRTMLRNGVATGKRSQVLIAQIIPGSRSVLVVVDECTLAVLDLDSGKCRKELVRLQSPVTSVCLDAAARLVLVACKDRLRLLDASTGGCIREYGSASGCVGKILGLTSDNSTGLCAAAPHREPMLQVWDLAQGQCTRSFRLDSHASASVFLADGRFMVAGGQCDRFDIFELPGDRRRASSYLCLPRSWEQGRAIQAEVEHLTREAGKHLSSDAPRKAYEMIRQAQALPDRSQNARLQRLLARVTRFGRRVGLRSFWLADSYPSSDRTICGVGFANQGQWVVSADDRSWHAWDMHTRKLLRTESPSANGGHGAISSLAIGSKGDWVICATSRGAMSTGEILIWRLKDKSPPQVRQVSDSKTSFAPAVVFLPSGERFVSVGDRCLRLWNTETLELEREVELPERCLPEVAASPDGRWLLASRSQASGKTTPVALNLATGAVLRIYENVDYGSWSSGSMPAITPNGRQIVWGSRVWDVTRGHVVSRFRRQYSAGTWAVSPDGGFVLESVPTHPPGPLKVWSIEDGLWHADLAAPGTVRALTWDNSGEYALCGGHDGIVRLYRFDWDYDFPRPEDRDEGALPYLNNFLTLHCATAEDHVSRAGGPTWSEGDLERLLEELQYRGYGRLRPKGVRRELERMTREWKGPPPLPGERSAEPVGASSIPDPPSPKRETIRIAAEKPAASPEREPLAKQSGPDEALATPQREVVKSSRDGANAQPEPLTRIASFSKPSHHGTLTGHRMPVTCVRLSPDGQTAVSSGSDAEIRLWDVRSGQCRCMVRSPWTVYSIAMSSDARFCLCAGEDSAPRLWELPSGNCIAVLQGHAGPIGGVAMSADDRLAISACEDSAVRLWELPAGKCLRTFEGHRLPVYSAALSPDGRLAASGARDNSLRLWDTAAGQCIRCFDSHTSWVRAVALCPDGRSVVSGCRDGTLRLWDIVTGACLRTFTGHTKDVASVDVSSDGRWILSSGLDNKIRLWELATGTCLHVGEGNGVAGSSAQLSRDNRFVIAPVSNRVHLWELAWNYEAVAPTDWDEGARPHLETFLTLRCQCGEDGISRVGKPKWTDQDFQELLRELQYRGYRRLRPKGVRRELEKMTREWAGPPPLPGVGPTGKADVSETRVSPPRKQETVRIETRKPPRSGVVETPRGRSTPSEGPATLRERTCPRCGKKAEHKVRFCVHCGQKLASQPPNGLHSPPETANGTVCSCGFQNSPGNAFCNQCGKPLSAVEQLKCPHCSENVPAGAVFCVHCGKKVRGSVSS